MLFLSGLFCTIVSEHVQEHMEKCFGQPVGQRWAGAIFFARVTISTVYVGTNAPDNPENVPDPLNHMLFIIMVKFSSNDLDALARY